MPWFDLEVLGRAQRQDYLRAGGGGGEERRGRRARGPCIDLLYVSMQYDGDTENSLPRLATERPEVPFNLRATVDGDARRSRRHSTDESAVATQSVQDMDHSEYLQGYQSSTPMQPGMIQNLQAS